MWLDVGRAVEGIQMSIKYQLVAICTPELLRWRLRELCQAFGHSAAAACDPKEEQLPIGIRRRKANAIWTPGGIKDFTLPGGRVGIIKIGRHEGEVVMTGGAKSRHFAAFVDVPYPGPAIVPRREDEKGVGRVRLDDENGGSRACGLQRVYETCLEGRVPFART